MSPLSAEQVITVRALADACAESDGTRPLNEQALLQLDDGERARHHLALAGTEIVGYAQGDPRLGTGQLLVSPGFRRRGHGTALWRELNRDVTEVWAFGNTPAARAFAARLGLRAARSLLKMERPLTAADAAGDPGGHGPTGAAAPLIRPFELGTDAEGLLAVNAEAFAWHPEQRHFSRADLADRMAEDWFDPAGLLVAVDDQGVAGFHWTKRHGRGMGEVYIIATASRAQGSGLGRRLLAAGLRHLVDTGCTTVSLFVDGVNTRARDLYDRDGFRVVHADVLYRAGDLGGTDR